MMTILCLQLAHYHYRFFSILDLSSIKKMLHIYESILKFISNIKILSYFLKFA